MRGPVGFEFSRNLIAQLFGAVRHAHELVHDDGVVGSKGSLILSGNAGVLPHEKSMELFQAVAFRACHASNGTVKNSQRKPGKILAGENTR